MEPVEINAGTWYLRPLRADDRIDDRPALAELGETDPGYVARRAGQWESDAAYSWAVCEPTTGELSPASGGAPHAVVLDPAAATVRARSRPGHDDAAKAAEESVRRFAHAF